jgi:hypothetical protein
MKIIKDIVVSFVFSGVFMDRQYGFLFLNKKSSYRADAWLKNDWQKE